jgi:hypothetical protein
MRKAVAARRVAFLGLALAATACAGVKQSAANPDAASTPGSGGISGTTGSGVGTSGTGGGVTITGVSGTVGTGGATGAGGTGACVPSVTCNPPGGQYCGKIGNGCPGGSMECGNNCPAGWTCEGNLCVGGSTCPALTCGSYCGMIGDNCGHTLMCAGCPGGQQCQGGICVTPGCVPLTCNGANNTRYCGSIGDGCGGTLDCGTCPGGSACGSGGVPNVCRNPNCTPITCTPMGGQYCGMIGDGCGGVLNCGTCGNGMACPTTGAQANVCPGSMGTGTVMPTCTGATKTTISGTVYDPAGVNPLYNIIVYVPSGPLPAITEGVSCERCAAQVVAPLASALTDTQGRFTMTLEPVPSTTNVPVVMQIGKWRRQIMLPSIRTCQDNPITDKNQTRLPRTSAEGHIPRIAITTGGSDALECLPRRIGVADSEITNDAGNGRVHLYAGGDGTNSFMAGGAFSPATALWSNRTKLATYDAVIMSCEGSTSKFTGMKPQASIDNVTNYANSGGRVFLSHLHFYWLQMSPMFAATADYPPHMPEPPVPTTEAKMPLDLTVNTTFPKGMALSQWLAGPIVMASPTPGRLTVAGLEHSVTSVTAPTTEWIYLPQNPRDSQMRRSSQYVSFNTPVGTPEAMQCGKAVFTDIHIKQSVSSIANAGGDDSDPSKPFPSGCQSNMMTPQAKALEFLFFDLTSCVEPPTTTPVPPLVPPPGAPTGPPPSVMRPPAVPPPPPPPPPPMID